MITWEKNLVDNILSTRNSQYIGYQMVTLYIIWDTTPWYYYLYLILTFNFDGKAIPSSWLDTLNRPKIFLSFWSDIISDVSFITWIINFRHQQLLTFSARLFPWFMVITWNNNIWKSNFWNFPTNRNVILFKILYKKNEFFLSNVFYLVVLTLLSLKLFVSNHW